MSHNPRLNHTNVKTTTIHYTYDKQRRITKITKPSGKSIETTYTNGRMKGVR